MTDRRPTTYSHDKKTLSSILAALLTEVRKAPSERRGLDLSGLPHFRELPCNSGPCDAPSTFFLSVLGDERPVCQHGAPQGPNLSGPKAGAKRRRGSDGTQTQHREWVETRYLKRAQDHYCKADETLRVLKAVDVLPECSVFSLKQTTADKGHAQSMPSDRTQQVTGLEASLEHCVLSQSVSSMGGSDPGALFLAILQQPEVDVRQMQGLIESYPTVIHMQVCIVCKKVLQCDRVPGPSTCHCSSSDSRWEKPIHIAVRKQQVEAVRILLPEESSYEELHVNSPDHKGSTPLHRAAYLGNLEMVQYLLQQGADVSAKTKGQWLPIHNASQRGHECKERDKEFAQVAEALASTMVERGVQLTDTPGTRHFADMKIAHSAMQAVLCSMAQIDEHNK